MSTSSEQPEILAIVNALKEVIDPELGLNIVDLGLIYEVAVDDKESRIDVTMTLTTPGCPMSNILPQMAENKVKSVFPDFDAVVELVWSPAWSAELISEEGRSFLGMK